MRFSASITLLAIACGSSPPSGPDASLSDGSFVDAASDVEPDADTANFRDLTKPSEWSGVDLTSLFSRTTYFENACFDGRYIYWGAIVDVDAAWQSALVRYDTHGGFGDLSSWAAWAPTVPGLENRPMVFDGRYIYLGLLGGASVANEVRYDSQAAFGDMKSLSYSMLLPGTLAPDGGGYALGGRSATFDGRYVYFAEMMRLQNGEKITVRFDTQGNFQNRSAWSASSLQSEGLSPAIFAAPWILLQPASPGGVTVLYDTRLPFEQSGSWSGFSLQSVAGNEVYVGAGTQGEYVYYVPRGTGPTLNGLVARWDMTAPLSNSSSWQTFETTQVNSLAKGFQNASWDGRYFYFMVGSEDVGFNGAVVARYDTTQAFQSTTSRSAFDMTPLLPATATPPSWGGGVVFDGEYVYIAGGNAPICHRRSPWVPFPPESPGTGLQCACAAVRFRSSLSPSVTRTHATLRQHWFGRLGERCRLPVCFFFFG